jgi:hypothetical protein
MKIKFLKWGDAFYLGPFFIEWEPWFMRIGLTLFFWIVEVEFRGAFTKGARERRQQLKAAGIWDSFPAAGEE